MSQSECVATGILIIGLLFVLAGLGAIVYAETRLVMATPVIVERILPYEIPVVTIVRVTVLHQSAPIIVTVIPTMAQATPTATPTPTPTATIQPAALVVTPSPTRARAKLNFTPPQVICSGDG